MRRLLIILLVIIALTLVAGFGATTVSTTTCQDENISTIVIDNEEQTQIHISERLTVLKDDGYLLVKSEAVGENYIIQVRSVDGLKKYGYIPYTNEFQTVPLPDSNKVTLLFIEKTDSNYGKILESIEFHVNIKNELKRYTLPNVFVYYDKGSLASKTAKQLKNESNSDLEFVIKAFKMVSKLPYDYEKYFNINELPLFYIPDVDEVLISKTGICSDKAALLAAMLRSQGIPTKYVTGEIPAGAHAWNEIYIDNVWRSVDVTAGTFWTTSDYETRVYK
ncbi:hypothetical protein JCM17380_13060 [Desulfosporosinus burensis]